MREVTTSEISKIARMVNKQNELNLKTNGDVWLSGFTTAGKHIDWDLCIQQETAEFIDSFPWKHWKGIDVKADINNAFIELTDIAHFVFSKALKETDGDVPAATNKVLKGLKVVAFDVYHDKTQGDVIACAKDLIIAAASGKSALKTIKEFIYLMDTMNLLYGFNIDKLYTLYMGKNLLNKFRQDNGYSEGEYIKDWDGEEDNVYLTMLLEKYPDLTDEELLTKLQEKYALVLTYG